MDAIEHPKMDHGALFERLRKSGAGVVGPQFAAVTAYNLGLQDGIDAAAEHYRGAVDLLRTVRPLVAEAALRDPPNLYEPLIADIDALLGGR